MPPTQSKTRDEDRIIICQARRKDGEPCRRLALRGEKFCWQHSPSFRRRLRKFFLSAGGVTGLLAITSLLLNLFRITDIISPPISREGHLYYVLMVDASSRMSDIFDGDKTKLDAVREATLGGLLPGLPPGANFGLILLGGNTSPDSATCDSVGMSAPLTTGNRDVVGKLIENQQADGAAPLAKAIDLASGELLGLPDDGTERGLELFVFLGGGDSCADNDLRPLLSFLQNTAKYLTETHVDIFILSDEAINEEILRQIEESNQELENVKVKITSNAAELDTAVNESSAQAKTRAREIAPSAVAAEETVVVQNLTSTRVISTNALVNSPTPSLVATTLPPTASLTNSPSPIVTASITPSPLPTPIPPTQIPPTEIPPTAIPPTPLPLVTLLSASYLGTGESCSVLISFEVSGSPATGSFHVWNSFYGPDGDVYQTMTLLVGANNYPVGLGGNGNPAYYRHEVWFEYNGTSSNRLTNLVCPGLTPSP